MFSLSDVFINKIQIEDTVSSLIDFFCHPLPQNSVTEQDAKLILKTCENTKPDRQLFNGILELLVGQPIRAKPEWLSILQPNAISLPFLICNGAFFGEALDFFIKLTTKSEANRIACHENNLDGILIQKIRKIRETVNYDKKLFNKILQLFETIAKTKSSPLIVKSFLSLLSPLQNSRLSDTQNAVTCCLQNLVFNEYWKHHLTLQLGSGIAIEENCEYKPQMTFAFWVNINQEEANPLVVLAMRCDAVYLAIAVSSKNIFFMNSNENDSEILKFDLSGTGQWQFISIAFDAQNRTVSVSVDLKKKETQNLRFSDIQNQGAFAAVGGEEMSEKISEVGTVGIYSGADPNISRTQFIAGPVELPADCSRTIFIFMPKQLKTPKSESFGHFLIDERHADLIYPIFLLFQMPFQDGTYWDEGPEMAITIYIRILLSNEKLQDICVQRKRYKPLEYLMMREKRKFASYAMHKIFYQCFLLAQSPQLKQVIFDVLLNLRILQFVPSNEQLLIIEHFTTNLLPHVKGRTRSNLSFGSMLDMVCKYYPLGGSNNNIPKCRAGLRECLSLIASFSFLPSDLESILRQTRRARTVADAVDLLQIMLSLAHNVPRQLKAACFGQEHLERLLDLLNRDESIIIYTLEVIIAIHTSRVMPRNELAHTLDLALLRIDTEKVGPKFYESCLRILSEPIPEIFPICAWYAYTFNGHKELMDVLQSLTPSTDFSQKPDWAIWPILFAATVPEIARSAVVTFLLHCAGQTWQHFFVLISAVCQVARIDPTPLQDTMINQIFANFLGNYSVQRNQMKRFLNIAFYFFFHRLSISDETFLSPKVNRFYNRTFLEKRSSDSGIAYGVTPRAVLDELSRMKPTFIFGLRTSSDGKWHDLHHMTNMMTLVAQENMQQYCPICGLACYFMAKKNPTAAVRALSTLPGISKTQFGKIIDLTLKNKPISPAIFQQSFEGIEEIFPEKFKLDFFKVSGRLTRYTDVLWEELEDNFTESISKSSATESTRSFDECSWQENRYLWESLWSSLSMENGPWSSMNPQMSTWKRDNTECFCFAPLKLEKSAPINRYTKPCSSLYKGEDSFPITLIETTETHEGQLYIHDGVIEIVAGDDSHYSVLASEVKLIFQRTRFHKPTAVELFTYGGESFLIDFKDRTSSLIAKMFARECLQASIQIQPCIKFMKHSGITQEWVSGKISNFEYLMHLNVYSGRTFNDIAQYPIFPWIIADYSSRSLNFHDPSTFRDLSLPLGALDPSRFESLRKRMDSNDANAYLYSTGPLAPYAICLQLLRMEPFTSMHKRVQGGKFDVPERQILSIKMAWERISGKGNEIWELTPEFFFQPEFLINGNHLNIGERDGVPINDIELPPWAESPLAFVYMNRRALESDYVSAHLHLWIDLMWGVGQRRPDNLYIESLYSDVWQRHKNPTMEEQIHIEDCLQHVGQIPQPLFKSPHPQKNAWQPSYIEATAQLEAGRTVCISPSSSELRIFIITPDNSLSEYRAALSSSPVFSLFKKTKLPFRLAKRNIVPYWNDKALIFDIYEKLSYDFGTGIYNKFSSQFSQILCAASDGALLMVCGDECCVTIFREGSEEESVNIQLYVDRITCCAISDANHTFAVGTRDGKLAIGSTSTGVISRVLSFEGGAPSALAITNAWGFVAASIETGDGCDVAVYTINGDLVRRTSMDSLVTNIHAITSPSAFDFLVLKTIDGGVFGCEAFLLDVAPLQAATVTRGSESGLTISFWPAARAAVTVNAEGEVVLAPMAL